AASGGTVVSRYSQIGVVVARSSSSTFRSNLMKDSKIQGATATEGFATKINDGAVRGEDSTSTVADAPASDTDPLFPLQWDMPQIHTPEAHAITSGDSSVVVGDIDTGIDYTNPDLAPNWDAADSVNCLSG